MPRALFALFLARSPPVKSRPLCLCPLRVRLAARRSVPLHPAARSERTRYTVLSHPRTEKRSLACLRLCTSIPAEAAPLH